MAITSAFCNSFKQELLAMSPHTPTDIYKMALFTSAATLDAATSVYATTNEVIGTGYTAGGFTLSGITATLDAGVGILDWTGTDPNWPTSTITARGALIYNSSRANAACAVLDFGSDITSTNGTFTVNLPSPTAATGIIRIQ